MNLNPTIKKLLSQYGDKQIEMITIYRKPIQSYINVVLNTLSLGQLNKNLREANYDKLFHLYMIVKLSYHEYILIEKNERINIHKVNKIDNMIENREINNINNLTINQMLNNTINRIGNDNFYTYKSHSWNCQNFILNVLKSNNLLNNDLQVRPYLGDGPINGTTNYASMDNLGGKHDFDKTKPEGARYNYFTITSEMATDILLKGKNKNELVLSLACLKGTEGPHKGSGKDCHSDAVHYQYIPGQSGGQTIEGKTTGITDDQVVVNVATIKVCGG